MSRLRRVAKSGLSRLRLLGLARRFVGKPSHGHEGHGHVLLIDLLPRIATPAMRGAFLVEVGTTREKVPGQGSTVELAKACQRLGLSFVTVDMDPANTDQARIDLHRFKATRAVNAKGEDFLAGFDGPIVAAYLDAFDIAHGQHSQYRIDRYREFLHAEITDDGAQHMHLACAVALADKVLEGGLVVIDDTWAHGDGFAGKGATAVPFLLSRGYTVASTTGTAMALQRNGRA